MNGSSTRWPLRATDLDVLGHVNNAAYWAPVEQELARRGRPLVRRAEIEFRAGLDEGDEVDLAIADQPDGFACWLCVAGDVRASMLLEFRPEPSAREPGIPASSEAWPERPYRAEKQ